MCDREEFISLEDRVDNLENRMAVVETTVNDMRRENQNGFNDVKQQLQNLYGERKEWSVWLRGALTNVGKWVAKWGGVIIVAAIGFNHLPQILKIFGIVI